MSANNTSNEVAAQAANETPFLNTQPGPNHNWKVSLENKIIAIKGPIVFTASMTSYRPNRAAPSAPYGATKGAVRNMTHTLGMEWAHHGIRVNSISPGFVKTAMTYFVDQAPDWKLKMQYYGGMPRLADPKELNGAYVYLLSDAASYTTGIDIPVAGIVGAW